jgi:hypothetical protein
LPANPKQQSTRNPVSQPFLSRGGSVPMAMLASGFVIKQPSAGADSDDCFACRRVAELTIELATFGLLGQGHAGRPGDDRIRWLPQLRPAALW